MFRSNVINIKVTNAAASASSWTAFGFNAGTTSPSGGGATTTVTASPNSMDFINRENQQQPYVTKRIKIKVSDTDQFNNSITITGQVGSEIKTVQIEPMNYANPQRGISDLIMVDLPPFVIDGSISIGGTIDGNSSMNIIIEYDYVKRPGYTTSKKSLLSGDTSQAMIAYTTVQPNIILEKNRQAIIKNLTGGQSLF